LANIIEIQDLSAPELAVFARLTEGQLRCRREPEKGVFIAESLKVIRLALQAGCKPQAFLMERKRVEGAARDIIDQCEDIPVYTGDREVLAGLTGYALTRGVLCAMTRPVLPAVESIMPTAKRVAVLEGITDSTNVGAIFRSAAALQVDAVCIMPTCCDPLCRRAIRVSMGTVFQVPWTHIRSDVSVLHDWGFKTAAMALREDAISIEDKELAAEERLALVWGTEGTGLTAATIEACDYVVKIPMAPQVDSLNVAAASAVAFWQLRVKKDTL
jgi:tRNA G18 (ribose-2'-O)-methylase SpoU